MSNILFSVVIPTYNRADLIMETVDSVLTQTYTNVEILVVDNCSTDNTAEILQPLIQQNKIRYIRNEKNYERGYSRNIGLKNAKGDFLTLLDSDDFLLPHCLQDAYTFIQQNPTYRVFQNLTEVVSDNHELVYTPKFPSLRNQYKAICRGNFLGANGGFIAREVYQQFKFSEDPMMTGAEDYEFWFNVLAKYKLGRINKVNSHIRDHPKRSIKLDVYDNLIYQREKMLEAVSTSPLLKDTFTKYKGTLAAAFYLQEIIIKKEQYSNKYRLILLAKAVKNDFTVIFTKRFISVALKLFKN